MSEKPSEVSSEIPAFDKFASWVERLSSRAVFFAACVAAVVVWAPSYFLIQDVNTWQLIINTFTTCVTFLLMALLQNTMKRSNSARDKKLDAIAIGVANLLEDVAGVGYEESIKELKAAVGLEDRTSSTD